MATPRNRNSVNPVENVARQIFPAFPYDENNVRPAVLTGAIVDGDGIVVGYLPVKCTDNGDGTCRRS